MCARPTAWLADSGSRSSGQQAALAASDSSGRVWMVTAAVLTRPVYDTH
jgi:hypothetical protein